MNRREFMQCAVILATGVGASQLGFSLTEEQQVYLASAPDYNKSDVNYFSAGQRKIVAAMTEVVIPRTETPGAIDARVPFFIELMAANWLNDEESAIFSAGLKDMETRIPREHGKPFDQLTIWGFFTSEEGGSQVLRYDPMPMYFDGDIPLAPEESSWNNLL